MADQPKMPRRRPLPPPMPAFDQMVEQRIREAQTTGVFDDLPGAGEPLQLDDDALIPEELRAAYRLLKNSGFVPAEVEALRELHEIEQQLQREQDAEQRSALLGKLNLLLTRTGVARRRGNLTVEEEYFQKVAEKVARRK